MKHAKAGDAPDAVEVYRKVLAAASDNSVVLCTVGFLTNVRRLLESTPDAYSRLDGRALVAKKVHSWFAMACGNPKGKEYNAMGDAASSKIAIETFPRPIVFSDFAYGHDVFSGRMVAEREYAFRSPVKYIFKNCLPAREK